MTPSVTGRRIPRLHFGTPRPVGSWQQGELGEGLRSRGLSIAAHGLQTPGRAQLPEPGIGVGQ